MRVYETMIIFDPDLEEQEVRDFVTERVSGVLTERGATIREVDHWGKRPFAYEINHRRDGYYTIVTADAEPAAIEELARVLRLTDSVFRHKTVRRTDLEAASSPATLG